MSEGMTSLAKLRGQSDLAQTQKSTKPKKTDRNQHESEGGTENEAHDEGEGVTMGTKTQRHLEKHHRAAMKTHKTMAKHHEGLADAHHEMAEHHEVMLGNLTAKGRETNY